MRGFPADERDSTWERDDARYRLYVFEGPDNAVTTIDIVEATIEQALESAVGWARRAQRFAIRALWLSGSSILLAVIALLTR